MNLSDYIAYLKTPRSAEYSALINRELLDPSPTNHNPTSSTISFGVSILKGFVEQLTSRLYEHCIIPTPLLPTINEVIREEYDRYMAKLNEPYMSTSRDANVLHRGIKPMELDISSGVVDVDCSMVGSKCNLFGEELSDPSSDINKALMGVYKPTTLGKISPLTVGRASEVNTGDIVMYEGEEIGKVLPIVNSPEIEVRVPISFSARNLDEVVRSSLTVVQPDDSIITIGTNKDHDRLDISDEVDIPTLVGQPNTDVNSTDVNNIYKEVWW